MADNSIEVALRPCTYTTKTSLVGTGLQLGGQLQVPLEAGTLGLPQVVAVPAGSPHSAAHRPLTITTNSLLGMQPLSSILRRLVIRAFFVTAHQNGQV